MILLCDEDYLIFGYGVGPWSDDLATGAWLGFCPWPELSPPLEYRDTVFSRITISVLLYLLRRLLLKITIDLTNNIWHSRPHLTVDQIWPSLSCNFKLFLSLFSFVIGFRDYMGLSSSHWQRWWLSKRFCAHFKFCQFSLELLSESHHRRPYKGTEKHASRWHLRFLN